MPHDAQNVNPSRQPRPDPEDFAVRLSVITAQRPKYLSKAFSLDSEGKLVKGRVGALVEGSAKTAEVASIQDLAALVESLTPAQALAYGVTGHPEARVVTSKALRSSPYNKGALPVISRTREHFKFAEAPGILMLDHDGGLSEDDLLEKLYQLIPELTESPHLIRSSASSFIYRSDTGEQLRGASGYRVLVLVENTADIPRAAEALSKQAWLQGFGKIELSKSGAMLIRNELFDTAVFQPERLDFCGGARCGEKLEQRLPKCRVFNADSLPFDTAAAVTDLGPIEEGECKKAVLKAKQDAAPESARIQEKWIEERVASELKRIPAAEKIDAAANLRTKYRAASIDEILFGDFSITLASGKTVCVADLLDNPDRYHGTRCADPLEPDYRGDRRIAYIKLRTPQRPYIFSHAHGGRRFTLYRAEKQIEMQAGGLDTDAAKSVEILRLTDDFYTRCSEIVSLTRQEAAII